LWDRLDRTARAPLTEVVAPPGAGKTLGVAGWLQHVDLGGRASWANATVELTNEDLDRAFAGLDAGDAPRLLVVDDAHALSRHALHHLGTQALRRPHRVRVVLLSRWELPLADLRTELRGDVAVLRGDLLRLDEHELATLVRWHSRTDPDNDSREVTHLIHDWSRGWCAPAVLAAQAAATSADAEAAARRYTRYSAVPRELTTELYASLTVPQRQVLLCLAGDTCVSASQAGHLSRVPDAGRALDELASTGLLARACTGPDLSASKGGERDTEYLLHPVLVEMTRRRLEDGGGDVLRARTTLRDVVHLDIRRGVHSGALHRLVAMGDVEGAVQVLARHGLRLVLAGRADDIDSLLRDHSRVVESRPECWLAVAAHLWLAGDVPATQAWLERLEIREHDREHPGAGDLAGAKEAALERLCVQLMRALLGSASLSEVALRGRELLRDRDADLRRDVPVLWLAQLLHGLAAVQLGRLSDAETSLSRAANQGRTQRLTVLSARAVSALAIVAILQGREHVTLELTADLSYVEARNAHRSALLARHFAHVQARVGVDDNRPSLTRRSVVDALHPSDVVARALTRVHDSRVHLLRGQVAEAERALDAEPMLVDLPLRLQVLMILERALHAVVALDRARLDSIAKELEACGAVGEAAFVEALAAEARADDAKAIELCAQAVDSSRCAQPPVAAMALVVSSQLLDANGRRSEAQEVLVRALSAMEVRRNALPFLGWSRRGTSVVSLLGSLPSSTMTVWAKWLLRHLGEGHGGIFAVTGPAVATPAEQASAINGVDGPPLSPRERDVLYLLARGATYADVASSLDLSENTVKRHVSSLYTKLGVRRRSDALAIARTKHLL
jgi:ATP/maltotriose-dependent transcriptional regulator MalT